MNKFKAALKQLIIKEDGMAFVLVLGLVMLVGLIMVPLVNFMGTGIKSNTAYGKQTNNLYAADTGVQDAIFQIANQTGNSKVPTNLHQYGSLPNGYYYLNTTENGVAVQIKVQIYEYDSTPTFQITSEAFGPSGSTTTVTSYVQNSTTGNGGWFGNYALGALNGNILLQSSSNVNGNIAANGNITLQSSCQVKNSNNTAQAIAANGGNISLVSGSTVDGGTNNIVLPGGGNSQNTQASPISFPTLNTSAYQSTAQNITLTNPTLYNASQATITSQTQTWPSIGTGDSEATNGLTVQSNALLTANGDLEVQGNLTVQSSARLTVNGSLYVSCTITVSSSSSLTVTGNLYSGNNVTIQSSSALSMGGTTYLGGNLTVQSGCTQNASNNSIVVATGTITLSSASGSTLPMLISLSSNSSAITIQSSCNVSGYVYAPNGGILFQSSSTLTGAAVGTSITAQSGNTITYSNQNLQIIPTQLGSGQTDPKVLSYNIGTIGATPAALAISTSSLPSGIVSSAYSQSVAATGGITPYSWSTIAGSLPNGLLLNQSTGVIAGTPSAAGTFNFTVQVTDSSSPTHATATQALSITINPALAVSTTSLPNGTANVAYSQTLTATNGTTPYSWSISAGSLPSWANLSATTGAITGTPTAAGTFNFTIKVTDSASPTNATATQPLSIIINPALTITTSSLPNGTVGIAYSQTAAVTGGTTPYTWSISAGSLPSWANLNATTGVITGTPTATGTANFTVQVTDSTSPTHALATQALSITINPALSITTSSLPTGSVGSVYSQTVAVTGGTTPYTWSISSGSLPSWASLNTTTGAITGTPTTTGTANFTVQVTDNASPSKATATQTLSININVDTATKLVFTSAAQTIVSSSNGVSNLITIQTQDNYGNVVGVTSNSTINLTTTSSNGKFYSDYNGTTQITSVTIASGNNSSSFYYKDSTVGTPTIKATQSTGTPTLILASQQETVRATVAFTVSTSTNWSSIASGSNGPPLMGDTLTISSGATVTVNQAGEAAYSITLAGSSSTGNNGTLLFNANTSLTVANLTVGVSSHGTGSVNMSAGGTLTITGTVTVSSAGTWTPGTGSVVYAGSAAQSVGDTSFFKTYNNLILSGSAAKTIKITSGTVITGNLSIAPTGNATATLTGNITTNTLKIGGVNQTSGTYGSTSSGATHQNNTYFTSGVTYKLTVNTSS
jgi:Putative Ig domain